MPHRHYCTYFDHRYLPIGLALHESLLRVGKEFTLWVLAMDREAAEFLEASALPGVRVVGLETLEAFDTELEAAKKTRSRIEYYFTCSPCFPRYLITTHGLDMITYVDSDLFFFSSPETLFDELGDASVAIVPHRFSRTAERTHARFGRYNVGWLTFRATQSGLACLDWWRARCIEWCFDRVEASRYADQKYLDYFEREFRDVVALSNPGANLAPWNVAAHSIELDGDTVLVDGRPLVFFHYQGFRRIGPSEYDTNLTSYGARMSPALRDGIFLPYIAALRRAEFVVAQRIAVYRGANLRRAGVHHLYLAVSRTWRTFRARLAGNIIVALQ